jgi:hypothetical protein
MRTPTTYRRRRDVALDTATIPTLDAAAELATTADELLAFIPPDVNPVVITRQRLAALQAALDAFTQDAAPLLELEGPDA